MQRLPSGKLAHKLRHFARSNDQDLCAFLRRNLAADHAIRQQVQISGVGKKLTQVVLRAPAQQPFGFGIGENAVG